MRSRRMAEGEGGNISDGECEDLDQQKRLKAALHYTVGKICEEVEDAEFSKEAMAMIAETALRQCELFAHDLEDFARHAKRSTVTVDDVKLCCRRSPSLMEYISEKAEQIKEAGSKVKGAGPPGKGKKVVQKRTVVISDSDSD